MKDREIYGKTLPFSLLRLLYSFLALIVAIALPVVGFLLTKSNERVSVIVTGVCAIIGLIGYGLVARYLGYLLKAGQIAMITEGVTKGEMPDNIVEAGKEAVKKRFVATSVYFAINSAISAITSQLTRGINAATSALGKLSGDDNANNVLGVIGAIISAFISIILEYVNYCCLGWVFYQKDQNAFKSTCDGAVIYFQNWKTLLKNAGIIFGLSLLSLVVIGGAIGGLCYLLLGATGTVQQAIVHFGAAMDLAPQTSLMIVAGLIALIAWSILHSALVEPYILVGALRRYIEAAQNTTPTVDIYGKLCGLSSRFRKTYEKAQTEEPSDTVADAAQ